MIKTIFGLLIVALVTAYPITQANAAPKHDYIIDTDVSMDDAIAILYLLQQPNISVKAITIEGDGNAHCKPAYANIQGLLHLTNHPSIPAACGRDTPLKGNHKFPEFILTDCDTFNGVGFSAQSIKLPKQSAKDLMIATLKNAKQPMDILAIAPMTTIAEVITTHPELKSKIRMIYMMGGAIKTKGNIKEVDASSNNLVAEWNLYIDPFASHQVFHSGVPITLIPLDATNQAPMDLAFVKGMTDKRDTPAAKYVNRLFEAYKTQFTENIWYFWDPLAAVISVNESVAVIKEQKINITLAPEEKSGATIPDNKHGVSIRVCTSIDKSNFDRELMDGLNRS